MSSKLVNKSTALGYLRIGKMLVHICHDDVAVVISRSIFIQSNFHGANIPGIARLSGETPKSVFNSKIDKTVL